MIDGLLSINHSNVLSVVDILDIYHLLRIYKNAEIRERLVLTIKLQFNRNGDSFPRLNVQSTSHKYCLVMKPIEQIFMGFTFYHFE